MKLIQILSVAGWSLVLFGMFLFDYANPEFETMLNRMAGQKMRSTWNMEAAYYMFLTLVLVFNISLIGLYFNSKRNRRKTDFWRVNLIFLGGFAITGIIFFIFTIVMQ